jgi:ELMO domain-containing protein
LSLLLTLYLFDDSLISKLTLDIYKLSLHETQNFPFFVMGINLIRIIIQLMHANKLNAYFNKSEGKLVDVCGKFYAALYLELYYAWKNNFKTIKDSGFVLRDIELKAKKSPKHFINQLNRYIKGEQENNKKRMSYKFSNVPKIVIQKAESSEQEFTRLEF